MVLKKMNLISRPCFLVLSPIIMAHVIAKINQLIQIYFFLFPYFHVHIYGFCCRLESGKQTLRSICKRHAGGGSYSWEQYLWEVGLERGRWSCNRGLHGPIITLKLSREVLNYSKGTKSLYPHIDREGDAVASLGPNQFPEKNVVMSI